MTEKEELKKALVTVAKYVEKYGTMNMVTNTGEPKVMQDAVINGVNHFVRTIQEAQLKHNPGFPRPIMLDIEDEME